MQTQTNIRAQTSAMLAENKRRLLLMFGKHDQVSGEGMDGHDWKLTITDFQGLRTQWLTEEFSTHWLFKKMHELGSIAKFIRWYRGEHGVELSYDEVANQLFSLRCERDPSFAFATCYKIQDKSTGLMVPFTLNYAQRILLSELEGMRREGKPIRIVLLKARQWGGSTLVQLYLAWLQLFVIDGWNSTIIAQTKDTSRRIKGMYRKVLENIPQFVFGKSLTFSPYEGSQGSDFVVTDTKRNEVRHSVITVASYENYENTRGQAVAMAHYSECAYWRATQTKNAKKLITAVDGGILKRPFTVEIMESTANGNSGFFFDMYQLAKDPKNNSIWKALFIPFFYIENDMDHFENATEKAQFARWLIANKDNDIAPRPTMESGKYLYELWMKGATLEHIKWYIEKRSGYTSHEEMASEAPSDDVECFAFSGNKVFSMAHVLAMRERYMKEPLFTGDIRAIEKHAPVTATYADGIIDEDRGAAVESEHETAKYEIRLTDLTHESGGQLKIWKHPDKLSTANQYIVSVDVGGRSRKADYSVITVLNRWNTRRKGGKLEVVARWRGHLRYDLMAWKAVAIARYYKNAKLVFESNTFDKKKAEANDFVEQGDHIRGILNVIGDKYDNLYTRSTKDAEDMEGEADKKIGFQTNVKTKQDMVDNFVVMFEDGEFIDPDAEFYVEAGIYEQRPDGSYGNIVGDGNHDDILMSDFIGALVHKEMDRPEIMSNDAMTYIDPMARRSV